MVGLLQLLRAWRAVASPGVPQARLQIWCLPSNLTVTFTRCLPGAALPPTLLPPQFWPLATRILSRHAAAAARGGAAGLGHRVGHAHAQGGWMPLGSSAPAAVAAGESCLLPQAWAAAAAAPAALPATVLRHMMVADVFSSPPAGLQGPQVPDHERAVHVPDTRRRAKGGAPPLQLRCSSAVELLALCCMCTLVMWGLGSRPARMCSHRLPPASLRPPQETPTCWPRCATQWLTRSAHPRLHPPPWPLKLQWQRRSWT